MLIATRQTASSTARKNCRRSLFLAPLLAIALSSCGPKEHFVFVHGALWGAWVWDSVGASLVQKGAAVQALDLPAHGDDMSPIETVTMDAYVARIASVVDASPVPVHLVGHSLGGVVTSRYAEVAPEKLASLIYLAAAIPQDGQALSDLMAQDPEAQLGQYIVDNGNGTVGVIRDQIGPMFCAECSESQLAPLLTRYRDEPSLPIGTPVHVTPERFGSVPKRALFTTNDLSVSYVFQQQMASTVTMDCTRTLPTGHVPQLSRPEDVAVALRELARCSPGGP